MGLGVVFFMLCNWLSFGSPLPPKMAPSAVDTSNQYAPTVAGVLLPDTWYYPIQCLFGWHGFFTVSPVLLFAGAGLAKAIHAGQAFRRRRCLWVAAAMVVIIAGHVVLAGSFGGWSYGFRYLIPIIPILMFFLPVAASKVPAGLLAVVLAVSILFALIGAYNPWPPAYENKARTDPVASLVTNPIGANLSAWMREYLPGLGLTDRLGAAFISPDPWKRAQYLYLFYQSKGDAAMALRLIQPGQ